MKCDICGEEKLDVKTHHYKGESKEYEFNACDSCFEKEINPETDAFIDAVKTRVDAKKALHGEG